jgi:hypothetical protein
LPDPIDLGEAMRVAAQDQFWAIRGHAVQSYASLEQSLCRLFAALANTSDEIAGIIFFRISSTHARSKIIEKLFQRKFDDKYNLFRNSLLRELRPIDAERNEIVHWNVVSNISGDAAGAASVSVSLRPPGFLYNWKNSPEKDSHAILKFMEKCSFFARLLNIFLLVTGDHSPMPEADKKPWLDIFQQPIVYPPPAGHPLSLKQPALENPPQSS